MSIWIKNKKGETVLAPHSYEKTLVSIDRLVCWIEGTNTNLSFKPGGFGIAGGPIWTNHGIKFTKEELKELVKKMKEGSELRIAYPDQYVSTNRKRYKDGPTVEEKFEEDNNMIQVGSSRFAPKDRVKQWLSEDITQIDPDYINHAKKYIKL